MHTVETEDNIIEVEHISFSYGSDEVLRDISFAVKRGDYLGMVGPNGAGKTTLLKIILGLLAPSAGSVRLFGADVARFDGWEKIGYVPQKALVFDAQFPATVYEVVLMGRYGRRGLLHKTTAQDRARATRALEQVGMNEYRNRLIGDLSGGQQQRVFIARALAGEPEVLFLDEPTVGVDPHTRRDFYALLHRLNAELGLTLVLISHDVEMVTREVHHIACVDRALVCYATPAEFLKDTQSSKVLGEGVKIITHEHHH